LYARDIRTEEEQEEYGYKIFFRIRNEFTEKQAYIENSFSLSHSLKYSKILKNATV
jgi:hypothetical protein